MTTVSSSARKKSGKADAIIVTGVLGTAAMGAAPVLIDVGPLVAANGAMIGSLALLYDVPWSEDNTKKLINTFMKGAFAKLVVVGSIKAMWSVIGFTGIGIPAALTLNAATNALVTMAIGRAAKFYFERNCKPPDHEVLEVLTNSLTLGTFKEVMKIIRNA